MFVSQSYQILNRKTKELIKHYENKLRFFSLHLPFLLRRNHIKKPALTDKLNTKVIRGKFHMFAVLNVKNMNSIKLLPVWYGGGIGNNCNAFNGVGHLSYAGFIFPKR